ncbi:serine hydrolase domain-containing protein [uncultured Croceitalea sp.]|uniref:serine hydrolase domain-containing protein n=1 Tax=uncultured Croceitalea sp. TaxID=1798908 RepID=UPI003305C3AF
MTNSLNRIEKRVLKLAKSNNLPSLSLQVKTKDAVLNIDYVHPETSPQPIYGIGSATKFLSAMLIFKLVEDEQLNLKDKAATYVKSLDAIENGNSISVEQLLNHTSGLSDYTANPEWRKTVTRGNSSKEFETKFGYISSTLNNHGSYTYSNSNYLILQKIVETVLNQPYDLSFETFFENQGLQNIKLGDVNKSLQAFYAENSDASSDVSQWQENYGFDGGAYSVPYELNTLLQKFFVEKTILTADTVSQMTDWISMGAMAIPIGEGSISAYGNGVMKLLYKGKEYLGHAGGTFKYQSFMFYNKEDDIAISILTNCSGKHYSNVFFQEIVPIVLDNL